MVNPARPHVLIIDDEPEIGKLLAQACEYAGYRATATNTADTFREAVLAQPEFIIMDLLMPDADGIELFRYLMENKIESGIILVSGSDHRIIQSAARLAQAQGLHILGTLAKPFEIADIPLLLATRQNGRPAASHSNMGQITPADMEQALNNNQVIAYYQPQVNLKTNSIMGFEVLARWIHPEWGLVSPIHFMPVIEASDLIERFTECIIDAAMVQMSRLAAARIKLQCAINASALSLGDVSFPDKLIAKITAARINPGLISVEVTESKLFENSVKSLDVLTRLRVKGFELSIDDFGTGYSTFQQLQLAPFSEIKIDKGFVLNCNVDTEAQTIVRTSIELAQRLGIRCVAEGVETQAVAHLLKDWGCGVAQGFYYSRPLPADLFLDWVQASPLR